MESNYMKIVCGCEILIDTAFQLHCKTLSVWSNINKTILNIFAKY